MRTTLESLLSGFELDKENHYFKFKFGENNEYELAFEPLIFDGQMYVALYRNGDLLTDKVVVKAGYEKQ